MSIKANTIYPVWVDSCSANTFVLAEKFALRFNINGKNAADRKSTKCNHHPNPPHYPIPNPITI